MSGAPLTELLLAQRTQSTGYSTRVGLRQRGDRHPRLTVVTLTPGGRVRSLSIGLADLDLLEQGIAGVRAHVDREHVDEEDHDDE